MNSKITNYVNQFNTAYKAYSLAKHSLFPIFCEAYRSLSENDFSAFASELKADRSTINKMTKVCRNQVVMSNLEVLPASWSTLHAITLANDDQIVDWIEDGEFTPETTLFEFSALKSVESRSGKSNSTANKQFPITVVPPAPIPYSIPIGAVQEVARSLEVLKRDIQIERDEYNTAMIGKRSELAPVKIGSIWGQIS